MDKSVKTRFENYPDAVRNKLEVLRNLILKTAGHLQLGAIEESLKWGEPSYHVKTGSPIRIDWKPDTPHNCYVFFNCNTKLVDTFRVLYGDVLAFQGNRTIVLNLSAALPEPVLRHCIELALTYKKRKHLPLLGA
ncbi:DUF1801 domain-containing protein [Thalassolituus pacificus]|uniref:DUF1801 domain-containing protein n=1 Tax=Thalassolituus pacificus TaxID=2975440 RepID=A0A9X2WHX3_9GAMM|nr:DUF1801 domain-containing protein [Thalassolituus pacificus]MCT7360742.1 DUF1801 domain-containing protein [Thalassolituus pacificus]